MHPARQMSFDDLLSGLRQARADGFVSEVTCAETGLKLFCYSKSCVFDRAWNDHTMMARGLIVDEAGKRVVATPFPKFFNVGERGEAIPDLSFEVFEKLDGSLIILFCHDGQWRAATKGAFASEQAKWARERLATEDLSALDPSSTYLCEAIYPSNKIVVDYGYSALVLLAAYNGHGLEYPYDALLTVGEQLGWPIAKRHAVQSVSDLLARAKSLPSSEEGFVLRFANGHRLKVKGEEYLRIHRMVSRLTPLSVWEAMMAGDDLDSFRRDLPEEFWADFDQIRSLVGGAVSAIEADTAKEAARVRDWSDKDVGLQLQSFPAHVRSFIFPYRKQGSLMTGRTREALFRTIRPTGNRLDGYVPSSSVTRVFEEASL